MRKLRIGLRLVAIGSIDIRKYNNVWGDELIARGWQKYLLRHEAVESVFLYGAQGAIEEELDVLIHFFPGLEFHPQSKNVLYLQNAFPKERVAGGTIGVFRSCAAHYDGFMFPSQRLMEACTPGAVVPFATDPELFFPQPSDFYSTYKVAFVGNNIRSPLVNQRYFASAMPFDLMLYGSDWDRTPLAPVCQGLLPMPELPKLYTSCQINLNAHISQHVEWDTINLRIFDILACGGFILSDPGGDSLEQVFGDTVAYTTGYEDEWAKIAYFLANPEERQRRSQEGQQLVLSNHTYANRVAAVVEYLHELL